VNMMRKIIATAMVLVTLCSLLAIAAPATAVSAMAGSSKGGDGKIYAWGCDMSQWNVNGATYTDYSWVDFKKMKADGCDFVILRIGDQKPTYDRKADPTFVTLYNMAREAGMHVGAYYYCYKTTRAGAVDDAQWCIDIIEKNNMYFEYPIYFDVEAANQESLSTSTLIDLCLGWCETMEAAGYFPGVYSTPAHSLDELQASSKFNYDTWVAKPKRNGTGSQYDPNVDYVSFRSQYGMWQYKWYSDSYSVPSYDGSYWKTSDGCPLDCNVAFRDYPTIMQTYGYNNVVKKHTVNFETNGGSAVESVKVKDGDKLSAPTNPTKYAFEFGGWYCNPELTDPYDFNTPVPYDFTLYAKWNEANWSANNNLMPNSTQMVLNDFSGQGQIWPYWNDDAYNSVTMYNGVTNSDNWSWPSSYMAYENSFDAVNSGYIYVKKDGTAQFNVVLTYLDKDGAQHDLYLSDVANLTDSTDFAAGPLEGFYNVGSYIRNLGHAPASGNVKFTRVTYYVIGAKDSYVKLYDLKFTAPYDLPDPYKTMMKDDVTQLSGEGNYVYDNGVLTMNATSTDGYSIKMNIGDTINPTEMANLLMDVTATAPFNVAVELTNGNGDATMHLKNEFFNNFDLTAVPEALPAGNWNVVMYLLGYYEWNGGAVTSSTVKSVTVTLTGKGTLTMKALQASSQNTVNYVQDGGSSSGSLSASTPSLQLGDVNGDGKIATSDVRELIVYTIGLVNLSEEQRRAADFNGDGSITTADAREILMSIIT